MSNFTGNDEYFIIAEKPKIEEKLELVINIAKTNMRSWEKRIKKR